MTNNDIELLKAYMRQFLGYGNSSVAPGVMHAFWEQLGVQLGTAIGSPTSRAV